MPRSQSEVFGPVLTESLRFSCLEYYTRFGLETQGGGRCSAEIRASRPTGYKSR